MKHPGNKYEARMIQRRKLMKLYEETKCWYGAGAYKDRWGRIRKYSCNSKELRQMLNRRFRRTRVICANGGAYKKHGDYWWILL